MRIAGFASGFDIDQIVKELMAAHRKPLDRLVQQKQLLEWKREEYRSINSKLIDFRNNKLTQFRMSSQIAGKRAEISGEMNVVSAKASSNALSGTMTIKVERLATSAIVKSSSSIGTDIPTDKTLAQLKDEGYIQFSQNTFTINGASITIDPDVDTIDSLIQKINSNKDAKVHAFFDSVSGQMSLTSTETGSGEIALSGDLLTGPNAFNLNDSTAGQNARLEVNGLTIERTSNKFTINGVEITLHGISNSEPTMIQVMTDTDKIIETIKNFVDEYNKLISEVNSKLNEQRYRSYLPLTEEQKKELKDSEIELWEEKARSGMLNRDDILTRMVNELRLAVITDFGTGADAINMTSLGITTGQWFERGKLVIDEDKLRAAIEEDPEKVQQFFSAQGTSHSDKGIFNRMYDIIHHTLNEIAERAGTSIVNMDDNYTFSGNSSMGSSIRVLEDRMAELNRRLNMLEARYYQQFTAMEKAINMFNAQASSLFQFMN